MAENIVEKVLQAHLREGDCVPGKEIAVGIDQTLVHDATGTMAFLQFEALGVSELRTDLSVTYIDHNTQQIGFENSADHLYLQSVSAKFGAVYSRAGNGICHQVHLERFGKPGTTLLGADSHTPTGGGIGQIAIGAGGLDVAVAMGGGPFHLACPPILEPDEYRIADSMILFPDAVARDAAVLRGPNIGEPLRSEKMAPALSARVMIKLGDNITTDHITPAGARLKYRSNVPKYAEFVFENVDPSFSRRCLENKSRGVHNVIVAGESYGQGSSREHASMCPMYLGVKAVIAKSFERIHSANLVNFGVLPLVFRNPSNYDAIQPEDGLSAANWREAVSRGEAIVLRNERSGATIECTCTLSAKQTAVVLSGGLLNHLTSA